jgi:hypothetical protein
MTFRGHYINGVVVFDTPADLPDGAAVVVRRDRRTSKKTAKRTKAKPVRARSMARSKRKVPTLYEQFKDIIGIVSGPPDLAENHNHYAHGAPKRPAKRK